MRATGEHQDSSLILVFTQFQRISFSEERKTRGVISRRRGQQQRAVYSDDIVDEKNVGRLQTPLCFLGGI
jgi:hypothetical protein